MEYVSLNNGVKMPKIGLGTWCLASNSLYEIVKNACQLGYIRFDTAWKYQNERQLGEIFKSLQISREKIFIETKLHEDQIYLGSPFRRFHIKKESIRRAFNKQCKDLQTDYIDLYLVHWPFYNFVEMWEAIEKLYNEGRIRAIGVCSFTRRHFDELKKVSSIVPALNQIEISPYNNCLSIIHESKNLNIQIEAYTTLNGKYQASQELLNDSRLVSIAHRREKSVAQVINRWALQHGYTIVPRSNQIEHLKENINLFDFELDDDEMKVIDSLNKDIYIWGNPQKAAVYKTK